MNDFVINRYDGSNYLLEVWTYDTTSEGWVRVWYANRAAYIGDIGDFDNDGYEELMFSDPATDTIEIWGNDVVGATSLSQEAVVKYCDMVLYHDAASDLNGNGVPELILQCSGADDIEIYEWNGVNYGHIASVAPPLSYNGETGMLKDDMECNGDVNRDGVNDCIFCGNSGTSHVLTYRNGSYFIAYNAPGTQQPSGYSFTQTCSIGDINNDGYDDWFDSSEGGGLRVFSYKNGYYQMIWDYPDHGKNPPLGVSFLGDSDNDVKGEFLVGYTPDYRVELWESDFVGATSFSNTFTWSPSIYSANIIIGNLNPYNDDTGVDCNDNDNSINPGAVDVCGDGVDQNCDGEDTICNCADSDLDGYDGYDPAYCPIGNDCDDNDYLVNPGTEEVCADGIDNNCDGAVDEGCGPVCGDWYCEGRSLGENCFTCPSDCPSGARGVCCGDNKCDTRKGETASFCPVDCS